MKLTNSILTTLLFIATYLFHSPQALSNTRIPANHPDIAYMGRIHWDDKGHGMFNYPGTTALLRFKGTALDMETSPGSGKFIVEIDNGAPQQIVYTSSDSLLTIAKNLSNTLHTARITYAIEGYEFNPQFRSFIIDGELIPAEDKPDLKIEFIGNSITCGYGIEDNNKDNGFSYDTENHTLTYAYKTARELDADFNVVARSGIGIYRNYGGPIEGDTKTMPLEYDYTMLYNHDYEWDHSSFHPAIICINLGTNDTSLDTYDISLYESHYRDFLTHLRQLHPDSKIVLLTGCMLQGQALTDVKEVLDRIAQDYPNTYRFDMSPHTGELGYGASYHPSKLQAEKMASELTPFLRSLIQ
ncbi:MAG: lipase [Muribaculaceae bacterium]|nr:lipase [Muribaculaceae bacterium]